MYMIVYVCVCACYRYIQRYNRNKSVGIAFILGGFSTKTAQARANGDWSADLDESTMCGKLEPQQSLHCRACLG